MYQKSGLNPTIVDQTLASKTYSVESYADSSIKSINISGVCPTGCAWTTAVTIIITNVINPGTTKPIST